MATETDATLMMTTPRADMLTPNMVVGMRRSEAWLIVRALRAYDGPAGVRLAAAMTAELVRHGDAQHALTAV